MNLRIANLLFFILIAMKCFSQENTVSISGKLFSFQNTVSNVHIINLTTKHGTISNNNGEFEINVTKNDTLLISSIQFGRIKLVITKPHFISKRIEIYLNPVITNLDEVFLHGLIGSLSIDINKTPMDTIPKHNFIYKLSDLSKKLPVDEYGFLKAPNTQNMTDPIRMNGAGGSVGLPDYYLRKVRKLKAELKNKKAFPIKIKKELGIDFFTNKLHIPKDEVNRFLAYCEYKNIIEQYNHNNLLEVIKILQEESKNYIKIEK